MQNFPRPSYQYPIPKGGHYMLAQPVLAKFPTLSVKLEPTSYTTAYIEANHCATQSFAKETCYLCLKLAKQNVHSTAIFQR